MTTIFWEEYREVLLRQAYRLVKNTPDAHDLVQDTFIRAHIRQEQLRDRSATLSWLRSILGSIFCNQFVKRKRRGSDTYFSINLLTGNEIELRSTRLGDDPERVLTNSELAIVLHSAIKRLPANHRECLLLCDVDGLAYAEAASTLGVTLAVIKSRLHRARRQVRECITIQGFGE